MSQEKVEHKKELKKNRKSLVRKKKVEYVISICCVAVIAVAVFGWIGFSVYTKVDEAAAENIEYEYYDISTDAIQNYLSTLSE